MSEYDANARVGSCRRCGELTSNKRPTTGPGKWLCHACNNTSPEERLAEIATDSRLRQGAALVLLRLGLTAAADQVLSGGAWPTMREAIELQHQAEGPQL